MRYLCSKCGKQATSTPETTVIERFIGPKQERKQVRGRSLGTFRCPEHGKTSVKRVKE